MEKNNFFTSWSPYTVSVIDLGIFFSKKKLSEFFGRIKLHKKRDLEIYIFFTKESYHD